jgi:hypothetical protein
MGCFRFLDVLIILNSVFTSLTFADSWSWRADKGSGVRANPDVRIEALFFDGIPVVGVKRKFYRGVPLGRAFSEDKASIDVSSFTEESRRSRINELQKRWEIDRSIGVQWELTPALVYSRRKDQMIPAWEARASSDHAQYLFIDYLDPNDGKLIWRKPLYRKAANVYATSPYNDGDNQAPLTSVTLPGISGAATAMSTQYMDVKRQQSDGSGGFDGVAVDPSFNFSGAGAFQTGAPDSTYYSSSSCTGGVTACPNQGFNAVNVFYHVEGYREYVASLLTDIGEEMDTSADPILVLVNAIGFDVDGDGQTSDEVNNAFFTPGCRSDSYSGACLLFNPPARREYLDCDGPQDFYDLAREATTAVHEYQHYLTDTVTGMESGVDGPNVGDILHEGYSDYFAVSHVSRTSGANPTTILQYGFQDCPHYQRTIGTLKTYEIASDRTDPHYYGWTWASGLYHLRQQIGVSIVDKIALKSLYYLPTDPSFLDAVEALVQADKELNSSANTLAIRTLFYETLHFNGGAPNPFSDLEKGIVSMGVTSCLSVPAISGAGGGVPTMLCGLMWLAGLILGTRRIFHD